MSRSRSPSYPNFPLSEAIARVDHVFNADRQNPVDRETIAQHIGYRGVSGASDKAISTLSQYGLLEKVAKGELRVSSLAVDILHPDSRAAKGAAVLKAARHPALFAQLFDRFDVTPSVGALQSYLKREGYLERAINPISSAFLETCQLVEQYGGSEVSVDMESVVGLADAVEGEFSSVAAEPANAAMSSPSSAAVASAPADVFNFSTGEQVSIQLPAQISENECEDFKDWLQLMARRAERRVEK